MSGSYFMRVSNGSASPVAGVAAGSQALFSEGTFTVQLAGTALRGATSSGPAGSIAGAKARINAFSCVSPTTPTTAGAAQWQAVTSLPAGVVVEVGHIDNDGYLTAYFSS